MKDLLSGAFTFVVLLRLVQGAVGAPVFEDDVLLTSGKGGYHTYRIPAAVCTAKGTVLFFCEARKNSSSDFGQTHLLLLSSSDRGQTWSEPRIVWKDDRGRTWRIGQSTAIGPPIDPDGVHLSASWVPGPYDWEGCECLAAERPDGRLYLTVRNQAGYKRKKAYAFSDDGGESWSPLGLQDELPGSTCQSSIIGLPGGADGKTRILWSGIAASDRPYGRRDLTLFLSEDGARSFSQSRLVHPGPSAYSDMTLLPDRSVLLFYESGTTHRYESIRVARFNLDWLTQRNQ